MKKSTILKIILFTIWLVTIITYLNFGGGTYLKEMKLLKNGVVFEGKILKIYTSNNHNFGLILVKITSSNKKTFKKRLPENIFPYQIKDSIAEIYTIIDFEENYINKHIKLISDKEKIYIIDQNKHIISSSGIRIQDGGDDAKFIKENTILDY